MVSDAGRTHRVTVGRAVLAAKEGRWPADFEDACHLNGDPTDNAFCNLRLGCRVNNILDEIEMGRLRTTPTYLLTAARRCMELAAASL